MRKHLSMAAFIGLIIVLPLVALELQNSTITRHNASGLVTLFGLLYLLCVAFMALLLSMAQALRSAKAGIKPVNMIVRVSTLVVIGVLWGSIVIDQFPCFTGIPNCD